jgi:predicted transcriptional regulator
MKKDITSYSGLEKVFDDMTPEWIVPVGRVLKELEIGKKDTGNLKWGFRVKFNGKQVQKATPTNKDGKLFWRQHLTNFAIPDFVVLDKNRLIRYKQMVEAAKRGERTINPFTELMCDTGFYIEIFGDYYHSGGFVCGLSKEDHEKEVIDAYVSANKRVLVLWENEIGIEWLSLGLPKVLSFIKDMRGTHDLPEWEISKSEDVTDPISILAWRSLFSAEYFRALPLLERESVLECIFKMMRKISFPSVGLDIADADLIRFKDWVKKTKRKPTRFGLDFCSCFVKSIAHAKVKNKQSKYELWNDDDILKTSIKWQLENEDGRHHAGRFLNAVCFKTRFRAISNMHPSFVVKLLSKEVGDLKGKIIYDPCVGWGGRMLAAHCLEATYLGIDANKVLIGELEAMSKHLRSESDVICGDSSDVLTVNRLMKDVRADVVFTSPPYYDSEWYSNDKFQSQVGCKDEMDWMVKFLIPMVKNAIGVLKDDGVILLNVWSGFNTEMISSMLDGWTVEDVDLFVEAGGYRSKERLLKIRRQNIDLKVEKDGLVKCKICGREFGRLGKHLKMSHQIDPLNYLKMYGGDLIGEEVKQALNKKAKNRIGLKNNKRVAYRMPDGKFVRRIDAWERAWGGNPPIESKVDAGSVVLDPWTDKVENEDYVVCTVCGYKAKNLTRHVRKDHVFDEYVGNLKSKKCQLALQEAANKTWLMRKKKPLIGG